MVQDQDYKVDASKPSSLNFDGSPKMCGV